MMFMIILMVMIDHHLILMVPVFVGLLNGTLAVGLVPGKYIKRHLVEIYENL